MYEEFYGLTEKPFSIQPDPSFLYWGRGHRLAYAMLEYGVLNHAGISVVTGEVGCGKTTLIHRLLDQLSDTHTVALLSNIQPGRGDLLSWVLMGFGEPYAGKTHVEMFAQLQNYFISEYSKGRRVVLIIDEAQNLTVDMLEEIRMLSNINAGKDQLLQLILVGQPQLKDLLGRPDMLQLAQRIGSDFHLTPLSREEVHAYIEARLMIAGSKRRIFTEKAMDMVAEQSRGVPRVINVIADTALVYAFSAQDLVVDEETIRSVVRDKLEYGVFGLASSPNLTLSERKSDKAEKKTPASFLRDVSDFGGESQPAPRRAELAEQPRIVRTQAPAQSAIRLAAAADPETDDEEAAAPPFGGPSLYSDLETAPFVRREPTVVTPSVSYDLSPSASESFPPSDPRVSGAAPRSAPPVESASISAAASLEDVGVIIVGDPSRDAEYAEAVRAAPSGAHVIFVAPKGCDDDAEAAKAAGADIVDLRDDVASGGRARNAGYRRLKKTAPGLKFVLFVDAGDTLDPDWIDRGLKFMARRPEVAALEGVIDEGGGPRTIFKRVIDRSMQTPEGEVQTTGTTVMFRADAFEAAGGFRSDIFVDETEDLCLRLRRRGSHIWRLDERMAQRAAAPMSFGKWWAHARDDGFQYAAGAALHGAPPERFRVTEQARAVMWGMMFPLVIVMLAGIAGGSAMVFKTAGDPLIVTGGVLAFGVFIYVAKMFVTAVRQGPFSGFSWIYGLIATLGHFPEFAGVARYWFGGKSRAAADRP